MNNQEKKEENKLDILRDLFHRQKRGPPGTVVQWPSAMPGIYESGFDTRH